MSDFLKMVAPACALSLAASVASAQPAQPAEPSWRTVAAAEPLPLGLECSMGYVRVRDSVGGMRYSLPVWHDGAALTCEADEGHATRLTAEQTSAAGVSARGAFRAERRRDNQRRKDGQP